MKTWFYFILIGVGLFICLPELREDVWEMVETLAPAPEISENYTTISSYDGACTLSVDDTWKKMKRSYSFDNTLLDLQVGLKFGRAGVLVLAEPINHAMFYELTRFSEYASNFTKSKMENGTISNGPINVNIGGLNGHQYVLEGRMENRDVVILHTSLQGKNAFYQIAAITTSARLDKEKKSLLKVVRSFRETSRAANSNRPRIMRR